MDSANLWLVIAGVYWALLVVAMHMPGHAIPPELRPGERSDGTIHCLAYMVFAFLLCRAFDALHRRRYPAVNPPMLVYLFIFLVCVAYGFVDEETQPWTGRTADPEDWEADVLGSFIGCCLHLFVNVFLERDPAQVMLDRMRRRRRRSRRHRSHRRSSGSGEEHRSGEGPGGEGRGDDESRHRDAEDRHGRGEYGHASDDGHRRRRRRSRREHRDDRDDGAGFR